LNVDVGLRISDIVHCQHSSGPFVVDLAERPVSFLPCSVPESDLDFHPTHCQRLGVKLHSNCGLGVVVELAPDVLRGDVGLAGARIADEDYLIQLQFVIHPDY
jgi:hypothetical protein